ncbi:MFS general substrate transporter [Fusarium albosuccineum]|uniref:MFS general substrate transporter n=1 Tax=Fusarium albosuccineum TaxID=1237068 RepID=A0A8H4L9A7_9HYPO|nr:MFS general substrate transporter [Fusarium albosuccineum]
MCGIIATVLWGRLLDSHKLFKSRWALCNIGWLLFSRAAPVLDIYSSEYAKAIAGYSLREMHRLCGRRILGVYNNDIDKLSYTSGILRSAESLGFAIAYGIGSKEHVSLMTNLAVSFAVFVASVPFTCYVAWKGEDLEDSRHKSQDRDSLEGEDRPHHMVGKLPETSRASA